MSFEYETIKTTRQYIRLELNNGSNAFPSSKFDTDKTTVISMGSIPNEDRTNLIRYVDVRGSYADVKQIIQHHMDDKTRSQIIKFYIKEEH